jgi:hypothetical protein
MLNSAKNGIIRKEKEFTQVYKAASENQIEIFQLKGDFNRG